MRCMNCGWDNHSNTTVCLKCGQPLRMPENYANSQDIFISKEGHGEAIPKPTVLNVSSNEESFYCCTANYRMSQLQLPGSRRFHKLPLLRNSIEKSKHINKQ